MNIIREISGYCIEWGVYGWDGTFGTPASNKKFCFLPGCFDESLRGGHEILLTQDCEGAPIFARRSDGTLIITTDDIGLIVTARLIDTPENRLLLHTIDAGRVRGWSHVWEARFPGFRIRTEAGITTTDHFRAHLTEVSLVISKVPRMKKSAPMFIAGGPQPRNPVHA